MGQHLAAHRPHPPPAVLGILVEGRLDGILDAIQVMRVGQIGLAQFGRGAGELAEHQGTAQIAAAGHVLLGDQVHAVTQRCHQHHVTGHEEGE